MLAEIAVAATMATIAGCGDGGDGAARTGTVPAETQATTVPTETHTTTTMPGETTTTMPGETTIPWPPAGLKADQTPVLRTPSGNIECALDPSQGFGVVCDALQQDWSLPPKPADCKLEWTDAVYLRSTGRVEFWCSSNPAFGPPNVYWPRTGLPYGASVRSGGITCTSRLSGLTCTNREGHGFFLSRERVDFF